ncbi:response regulator [Deferribacter autotrophicus]|uniref:Response regulator n=1 Tax=Deferribacter autotrophicus TaxID=500465 RepID=A0A5A8F6T4_9BACT|nr:response regulator [Deferribacter autotrophicus]KAA0259198.1 response regulator [Deferribacter autotrophicus]
MKCSILILDDDIELSENMKELLEDSGFEVMATDNIDEALNLIEDFSPSVLLVDYLMPDLDGISFLSRIREKNKWIRIILMTAFPSVELAVDAIKKGANDFIAKPFKKDELITKINKSLEELKFISNSCNESDIDEILNCLSNKIRRDILQLLFKKDEMRFMEIVRSLNMSDHTKLNFHLKILIKNKLIIHKNQIYKITKKGINALQCIKRLI